MSDLPVLHGLDGCSVIQRSLRYMVTAKGAVPLESRLQGLPGGDAVARQYVTDPAVKALPHSVRLQAATGGEAMLNTRRGAELVEDVLAARCAACR